MIFVSNASLFLEIQTQSNLKPKANTRLSMSLKFWFTTPVFISKWSPKDCDHNNDETESERETSNKFTVYQIKLCKLF